MSGKIHVHLLFFAGLELYLYNKILALNLGEPLAVDLILIYTDTKILDPHADNTRIAGQYMHWKDPEISELWKGLDDGRVEIVTTKWEGNLKRIHC